MKMNCNDILKDYVDVLEYIGVVSPCFILNKSVLALEYDKIDLYDFYQTHKYDLSELSDFLSENGMNMTDRELAYHLCNEDNVQVNTLIIEYILDIASDITKEAQAQIDECINQITK